MEETNLAAKAFTDIVLERFPSMVANAVVKRDARMWARAVAIQSAAWALPTTGNPENIIDLAAPLYEWIMKDE